MNISKTLKQLRKASGLSLSKASAVSGMSKYHLHQLELGKLANYCNPTLSTLTKLADLYNTKISVICGDDPLEDTDTIKLRILAKKIKQLPKKDQELIEVIMATLKRQGEESCSLVD